MSGESQRPTPTAVGRMSAADPLALNDEIMSDQRSKMLLDGSTGSGDWRVT